MQPTLMHYSHSPVACLRGSTSNTVTTRDHLCISHAWPPIKGFSQNPHFNWVVTRHYSLIPPLIPKLVIRFLPCCLAAPFLKALFELLRPILFPLICILLVYARQTQHANDPAQQQRRTRGPTSVSNPSVYGWSRFACQER